MKAFSLVLLFLVSHSLYADTVAVDLKLIEANDEETEARFTQGNPMRSTSDAFGMIQCWGLQDKNTLLVGDASSRQQFYAEFSSTAECKSSIKKAKGIMGMRYGIMRFKVDLEAKKVISFQRL